jgi:hypothetical protein
VVTNVSEELAAFIFMVDASTAGMKNRLHSKSGRAASKRAKRMTKGQ